MNNLLRIQHSHTASTDHPAPHHKSRTAAFVNHHHHQPSSWTIPHHHHNHHRSASEPSTPIKPMVKSATFNIYTNLEIYFYIAQWSPSSSSLNRVFPYARTLCYFIVGSSAWRVTKPLFVCSRIFCCLVLHSMLSTGVSPIRVWWRWTIIVCWTTTVSWDSRAG